MKALDRRTLLKGMLGASAVAIGLPPLEAMGETGGFPRRFGVFFWGNGVVPPQWVPESTGADFALSPLLEPLRPVKESLLVVSGMRVATANTAPHAAGPAGLLSGDQVRNNTYSAPTLDQRIAAAVGEQTRFRSLETGVQRADRSLSHQGPNLMNPPETDPAALFQRLFGGGLQVGGGEGLETRLALRRSVLDAVNAQAKRLQARVGSADRIRLEHHLEGVRSIERELQRQLEAPPRLEACQAPEAPPADIPDLKGRPDMRARSRLMSDLLTMALACDQTRVFFHMYTQPVNNTLFPEASAGHHQLTHDELGEQPQVQGILRFVMEDLAYFLTAMRAVKEGDGTLLDHTVVLCTTDCSNGRDHSLEEYPLVLAGGAALGVRQNHHLRAREENASKLSLSLLQLFGVRTNEFGVGAGQVTEGLSGVLG